MRKKGGLFVDVRKDEVQILTYLFSGTVSALSRLTLVSSRIPFAFRLKKIDAYFPPGTNRLNQIQVFVSGDDGAPTTEIVDESNPLEARGNVDYLVGNDERRWIAHEVDYLQRGQFLKVHANNTDGVEHTIDVSVTIARLNSGGD
jgi:hypothetical protein